MTHCGAIRRWDGQGSGDVVVASLRRRAGPAGLARRHRSDQAATAACPTGLAARRGALALTTGLAACRAGVALTALATALLTARGLAGGFGTAR